MIVFSQNKNILADVVSLRLIKKRNKDTKAIEEIAVVGTLSGVGKDITLARYTPEMEDTAVKHLELCMACISSDPHGVFKFGGGK